MQIRFIDKLQLAILVLAQIIILCLWHYSVIKNGIFVFNNLGLSDPWFLPLAVLFFLVVNITLAIFVFYKNYFLRALLFLFSFLLVALELVILGYYLMLA